MISLLFIPLFFVCLAGHTLLPIGIKMQGFLRARITCRSLFSDAGMSRDTYANLRLGKTKQQETL